MRLVATIALAFVTLTSLAAEPRTPEVRFTQFTLNNGLRVIFSEDHSAPVISLNVTYDVGSRNERPGRTGFAHLFEHMMFKGSKNIEPEAHTSIVASVGGQPAQVSAAHVAAYLADHCWQQAGYSVE